MATKNGGNAVAIDVLVKGKTAKIISSNVSDTIEIKAAADTKVYTYIKELDAYKQVDTQIADGNIIFKAQAETPYFVFDNSGLGNVVKEGWNKVGESWDVVKTDGTLAIGWYNNNGTWYNLSGDGKMNVNWLKDTNGKWYFLKDSGGMATGWLEDRDGKWYYLKNDGSMAENEYVDGYYLGNNGAWVQ